MLKNASIQMVQAAVPSPHFNKTRTLRPLTT